MINPKIYVINATATGLDILNLLINKIVLQGVIGLDMGDTSGIANYSTTKAWAEQKQIPYVSVSNYSLKNGKENKILRDLDIDILIVASWQRLIPNWLINQCKIGVIGAHGSPWGITKGRGRSPQNWAIIMGEETFELSAFFIKPGADDGPVLATKTYKLFQNDDIVSSYAKVTWLYSQMIIEVIPKLLDGWRGVPQEGEPEYLPQRCIEDGQIDWTAKTENIDRMIRALTKPYPGAWGVLGNKRVYIWRAQPIEELDGQQAVPGEILAVFNSIPVFFIKTGDGILLVREWAIGNDAEAAATNSLEGIRRQMIFASFNGQENLKQILSRHQQKYPSQVLSQYLRGWVLRNSG